MQASTPLFPDAYGPRVHEGTSKNENLFEVLTENVSVCTIQAGAWVEVWVEGKGVKSILRIAYSNQKVKK